MQENECLLVDFRRIFSSWFWVCCVSGCGPNPCDPAAAFHLSSEKYTCIYMSLNVKQHIILEHIELPAKLLDHVLRSNKSNINQIFKNLQRHIIFLKRHINVLYDIYFCYTTYSCQWIFLICPLIFETTYICWGHIKYTLHYFQITYECL